MDSREAIIQATIELINEKGEHIDEITMRDICQRAGVGLGLINYHFQSKEKLVEVCVERIVNGIVSAFQEMKEHTANSNPIDLIKQLGEITLDFLFDHYAISKISMLTDFSSPKENDNTHRTYKAYLPLVSACRPDWDNKTVARKTFTLISTMQQVFLRSDFIQKTQGINLQDKSERKKFHTQLLRDILEI